MAAYSPLSPPARNLPPIFSLLPRVHPLLFLLSHPLILFLLFRVHLLFSTPSFPTSPMTMLLMSPWWSIFKAYFLPSIPVSTCGWNLKSCSPQGHGVKNKLLSLKRYIVIKERCQGTPFPTPEPFFLQQNKQKNLKVI